jgi:hypothetical protein
MACCECFGVSVRPDAFSSLTHPQYATRKDSSGAHINTQCHAVPHLNGCTDMVKVLEEFGAHPLAMLK